MCIVFMICELFASSLRIRSSRSLSDCDCAKSGRHNSVAIKPRASARRLSMSFLRGKFGIQKQRDYTESVEIDEVFSVSSVVNNFTTECTEEHRGRKAMSAAIQVETRNSKPETPLPNSRRG